MLQHWSDLNDVFQFVRIEDIAYDKRPGQENVVYLVDSGRGRPDGSARHAELPIHERARVAHGARPERPARSTSLTVFVEGDDNPVKTLDEVHQPDNIESTPNGILLTEDPGSSQQFPVGSTDPAATTARLWYVPFTGMRPGRGRRPVGRRRSDGRRRPAQRQLGRWETTGIVDASAAFGPGAFLLNVQAHTLWVEKAPGDDNNGDGQPDFTYKREGGQLVMIKAPGL